MHYKALKISILVLLLFVISSQHLEAQCALCKQAAASSMENDPTSMARGLNTGILYLMAIPYILIAFIFRKQLFNLWKSWRGKTTSDEVI